MRIIAYLLYIDKAFSYISFPKKVAIQMKDEKELEKLIVELLSEHEH